MLNKITINHVRQFFDGYEEKYEISEDNQLLFNLKSSEEFPYEIQVRFMVEDNWMKVYAIPSDFQISIGDCADYLLAVNHYNAWKVRAKASLMIMKEINLITLKLENIFFFEGPISVEYFVNGCILYSLRTIREFFDTIEECKVEVLN